MYVGGVQDAHVVGNVFGRQDKCGVESGILQKCFSPPSYLSDTRSGDESNVAGEEGNESSTAMEAEVIILAEFPAPAPAPNLVTGSVNDVPRDVKQQTTGSAGEEGNESSTAMKAEVIILAEFPAPAPAQSHQSLSVNDVPRDVKQQTTGSAG